MGRRRILSTTDRFEIAKLIEAGTPYKSIMYAYGVSEGFVSKVKQEFFNEKLEWKDSARTSSRQNSLWGFGELPRQRKDK